MTHIHNQFVIERANEKFRKGILKLIASGLVVTGLMAVHAPLLVLLLCSVGIVPATFTAIYDIKQGHDLKEQLKNQVESVEELENVTPLLSTKIQNETLNPKMHHEFSHELPRETKERSYQKVKKYANKNR